MTKGLDKYEVSHMIWEMLIGKVIPSPNIYENTDGHPCINYRYTEGGVVREVKIEVSEHTVKEGASWLGR